MPVTLSYEDVTQSYALPLSAQPRRTLCDLSISCALPDTMLVLARRPQTAALALGRQLTRSSVRFETALPAHHPSSSDASSSAPPSEISPKLPTGPLVAQSPNLPRTYVRTLNSLLPIRGKS